MTRDNISCAGKYLCERFFLMHAGRRRTGSKKRGKSKSKESTGCDIMKKLLFAVATIAAGLVFADFSPDTLAFYPFTDGAAGDSANGVTLKNAVAPGTNDAVSVQYDYPSTAAKGVIRFDDDVPGSYLFDDVTLALPDPVCSHLRSILITTDSRMRLRLRIPMRAGAAAIFRFRTSRPNYRSAARAALPSSFSGRFRPRSPIPAPGRQR